MNGMQKLIAAAAATALAAFASQAQTPAPTWELTQKSFEQVEKSGSVEFKDGVVKLDCVNSFSIPASVLGEQSDYTVEFELKRGAGFKNLPRVEGALQIISNLDLKEKAGFCLNYFPPEWDRNGGVSNRLGVSVNSYWNGECAGLDGDAFNKFSFVVKSKAAAIYRNGLLQMLTSDVSPSKASIVVGGKGWRNAPGSYAGKAIPIAYELRNLKIYNAAISPSGYDKSGEMMRNCSGDAYSMQRANIKDASLPRILVIGDSISMGYRGFITEHFKGKAYVDYWVGGKWFGDEWKGPDALAKRAWKGVLSNGPYDVISWNSMTLHMWNGYPGRCDEATYPQAMTEMLEYVQKSAPESSLIWVRCTPWRTAPASGRPTLDPVKNDRIVRLNEAADKIMAAHNVPEVDLYSLCLKRMDTVKDGSQDTVHWSGDVSREMAAEIIKEIEKSLEKKGKLK